jgi:hypothetical protein
MPTAGYNDSDTRAKLIDPAMRAASWIEREAREALSTRLALFGSA